MARTIGNPLSWFFQHAGSTGHHLSASIEQMGSERVQQAPQVRTLGFQDIRYALRAGLEDFAACRSDAMFLVLVYPLIGVAMVSIGFSLDVLPLIFPMIMGFALLGPVAAVGLYEMSRLREQGQDPGWLDAFRVLQSPDFGAILMLAVYLGALFVLWLVSADVIYLWTLGPEAPVSAMAFVSDALTTGPGWTMIIIGSGLGALFALAALVVSVVSFPLLLDRHVGLPVAVVTSARVFRRNPMVILTWGALIGVSLLIAALPLFLGMVVVLPVFGHATWHLYRRAVG